MKIYELVDALKQYAKGKPNGMSTEVFVSGDSEGNNIMVIDGIAEYEDGHYENFVRKETWKETEEANKKNWVKGKTLLTIFPTDIIINEGNNNE